MKLFYRILIITLFFPLSNTFAQLDLSHEFSISFGSVTMQTDYGERHHLPSSTPTSFGMAFSHYLSFYGSNYNWRNGASFFSDHFKLKSEVSYYFNNSLEHEGRYAANSTSAEADKLRAMKGTTKLFNLGTQLEYYFKNLEDYGLLFNDNEKFSPYISAGVQYNSFTPTLTSDNGNITSLGVLPQKYENNGVFIEKDKTFSFTASLGTRYKVNEIDLVLDARWQYFLSDKIEGLDANVSENKFNDTLIYFSFGAIIDLDIFAKQY